MAGIQGRSPWSFHEHEEVLHVFMLIVGVQEEVHHITSEKQVRWRRKTLHTETAVFPNENFSFHQLYSVSSKVLNSVKL